MDKLQAALKYAKLGYSVLPMNGKTPLIKFADQPALTAVEIQQYWSEWPEANVALRTTDFFVVDVDTKAAHGNDGLASAKELMKDGLLIRTLEQRTASGGHQFFYKKTQAGPDKQVIAFKPGIDIKAHINNYVIVPPSTTAKGQYSWIKPECEIQQPPSSLVELINSHDQTGFTLHFNHPSAGKMWTGKVLDNIINGVSKGQRNDHLTRLCGQMVHAGAESQTVLTLMNYANEFNSPPLSEKEVGGIVKSVLLRELRK